MRTSWAISAIFVMAIASKAQAIPDTLWTEYDVAVPDHNYHMIAAVDSSFLLIESDMNVHPVLENEIYGKRFVGRKTLGMLVFDGTQGTYCDFTPSLTDPMSNSSENLLINDVSIENRVLWMVSNLGVCRLKQGRFGRTRQEFLKHANCLLRDKNGVLWVGTKAGIVRFVSSGFDALEQLQIPGVDVKVIYEDSSGLQFLFTDDGALKHKPGAGFMRVPPKDFESLKKNQGKMREVFAILNEDRLGFEYEGVVQIQQSPNGTVWFNSNSSGLLMFDGKAFTRFTKKNDPIPTNYWQRIQVDNENGLWASSDGSIAGTFYSGAVYFDGKKWQLFDEDNTGISSLRRIRAISIDADNNAWFLSANGDICLWDRA